GDLEIAGGPGGGSGAVGGAAAVGAAALGAGAAGGGHGESAGEKQDAHRDSPCCVIDAIQLQMSHCKHEKGGPSPDRPSGCSFKKLSPFLSELRPRRAPSGA